MKCDELKSYSIYAGDVGNYTEHVVYNKQDADEAIAELKREIKRLKEENEMTLVGVNLHSPTSDGRFV